MKIFRATLSVVALLALAIAPASAERKAPAQKAVKSDNVKVVAQFKHDGGTELAAEGDYVYSGELDGDAPSPSRGTKPEEGGVHIYDVSGSVPKEVGFLHCPGNDNDVEVVKPGLIVMSFHVNKCAPAAGNGFMTIDVKNPKKPRILGFINTGKNHTMKPVPGTTLVYTAGGGLSGGPAAGPMVVDVKNPSKPEIVARPQTITMDCHDISFHITEERQLGFCAGAIGTGEVQIWDVSDPLNPTAISRIYNPLIQYSHYAVANTDGTLLAIDDEAFAAHDCNTHASPTGRAWIYDITDPALPIVQSSFAPPRGGDGVTNIGTYPGWAPSWCLSHGLDWMPDSNNLAVTWFTGGVSVLNLDDPLAPVEVAYYQAQPQSSTYSVLWHDGLLWANNFNKVGVMAYKIKGLK